MQGVLNWHPRTVNNLNENTLRITSIFTDFFFQSTKKNYIIGHAWNHFSNHLLIHVREKPSEVIVSGGAILPSGTPNIGCRSPNSLPTEESVTKITSFQNNASGTLHGRVAHQENVSATSFCSNQLNSPAYTPF